MKIDNFFAELRRRKCLQPCDRLRDCKRLVMQIGNMLDQRSLCPLRLRRSLWVTRADRGHLFKPLCKNACQRLPRDYQREVFYCCLATFLALT